MRIAHCSSPMSLADAIDDVQTALGAFFADRFDEAKTRCEKQWVLRMG